MLNYEDLITREKVHSDTSGNFENIPDLDT